MLDCNQSSTPKRTIRDMFAQRVSATPMQTAVHYEVEGKWEHISWQEYGAQVDSFSNALIALGLSIEDKIALIGHNTQVWFVADMSIMTTGFTTVPIYETSSRQQILYILQHSEAKVLVVENTSYLVQALDILDELESLQFIVIQNGHSKLKDDRVFNLSDFLQKGLETTADKLNSFRKGITPEMVATLIYTSGTTGNPKAVMLTHKNSVSASMNVYLALAGEWDSREKKSCSYLPLSHVAERVVNLLSTTLDGRQVYLFPDMNTIMGSLQQVCPTMWLGVPRIWEKMHEGIVNFKEEQSPLKQMLIDWALSVGLQYNGVLQKGKKPTLWLSSKYFIAKQLVINKILKSLGLDQVRFSITGGAPCRPEIADFFSSLGLWLLEVYGQTEGYGTTSLSTKTNFKYGSCGKPFSALEVVIADDGEILMKGDSVSPGYYKEPQLTTETFKDGWLYSGDLGRVDEEGYLWVVGRKKDIIITSGGKNITPQKIENYLSELNIVNCALVVGEGRKYLTAIIDLNHEKTLEVLQQENGCNDDNLRPDNTFLKEMLDKHVATVNGKLSRVEQIKKYVVLFDAFSAENGLLTNTLKLKKKVVLEKYIEEIETMY